MVPVTVAVNIFVVVVGTEALVGLMLSRIAAVATTLMFAEAALVGSAMLVAVTRTVAGEATLAGEV